MSAGLVLYAGWVFYSADSAACGAGALAFLAFVVVRRLEGVRGISLEGISSRWSSSARSSTVGPADASPVAQTGVARDALRRTRGVAAAPQGTPEVE